MILTLLASAGCGPNLPDHLTIAAASSMRYVIEEIVDSFEKRNSIEVDLIYGSSGKLAAQIEEGAPFDVFISADLSYSHHLLEVGASSGPVQALPHGVLVLWSMDSLSSDLKFALHSAERIALANPLHAPYGKAAMHAIEKLNLYQDLRPKLVIAENVGQVNQFVTLRAVHVGITAKSVVSSDAFKEVGSWIELPMDLYPPIAHAVLPINKDGAHGFIDYLKSTKARSVFHKYGYKTF